MFPNGLIVLCLLSISLVYSTLDVGTSELFPVADEFFETEFWDHHKPGPINMITKNWICDMAPIEKVKLCVKILEDVKSNATLTPPTKLQNNEIGCVERTVVLKSVQKRLDRVNVFRCPLTFTSDSPNFTVGSVDLNATAFYITRGISSSSFFVLHDISKKIKETYSEESTEVWWLTYTVKSEQTTSELTGLLYVNALYKYQNLPDGEKNIVKAINPRN